MRSHWGTIVAAYDELLELKRSERYAKRNEVRAQERLLKDAGWNPDTVFFYPSGDAKASARAREAAERYAQEWQERTGVKLKVYDGMYL